MTTDTLTPLLDHHQLDELVHRLGACLDEARFEELRPLLTTDVTASTPGGAAEGIDAVVAQARRNHTPDERIQHAITDVLVDLDRDDAVVRANLVVTFGPTDGGEVSRRLGGIYRFGARRTSGGWQLTSIVTTPVWREGELPVPVPAPG